MQFDQMTFLYICLGLSVAFMLSAICFAAVKIHRHRQTAYFQQTGNSYLKTKENKGLIGEFTLGQKLAECAPEGKLIFNAYIPREDGSTSEVDVIFILPNGIYVFENKNYSGWIFGDASGKVWTETFHKRAKYTFLNPVLQNAGHIKALVNFLDLPEEAFVPIVVFADKATFKKLDKGEATIIKTSEIPATLQKFYLQRKVHITEPAIAAIYNDLLPCTNASEEARAAHIARIQERNQKRRQASAKKGSIE